MDFKNLDMILIASLVILAILGWLTGSIIPIGIWIIAMAAWAILFGVTLVLKNKD